MEFNTIAVTDGVTMGTEGMKSSLVSREVIADSIELVARGHMFDGLVCIVGCDKTLPGRGDGAGAAGSSRPRAVQRHHQPGRRPRQADATIVTVYEAIGAYRAGKISLEELVEIEDASCPGPGACGGQFTANTMSMALEFLGLSPAGLNGIPATDPAKLDAAHRSGELVMELRASATSGPRRIVTRAAIENAIASRRRDRRLDQRRAPPARHRARDRDSADDRRLRPHLRGARRSIAYMMPGGRFTALDLHERGWHRAGRRELRQGRHGLDRTRPRSTVARSAEIGECRRGDARPGGRGLHRAPDQADRRPRHPARAASLRTAASSSSRDTSVAPHRGPARVFDSEAGLLPRGARAAQSSQGDVVVIRYEGPVGGPGMQEMLSVTARARGRGAGRVGGAAHGRPLLRRHARPDDRARGAGGGARRTDRAASQEGDTIVIDVDARRLDLRGGRAELARRGGPMDRAGPALHRAACCAKYAALVSSASEGAVTTGARLAASLRRG